LQRRTLPPIPPLDPYREAIVTYKEAAGKGLMGKALEALDRAIKLDPNRYDAYFYRAGIFSVQNKPEAAIEDYSKVIELDPKASTAYNNRGWEQFKLNKIDRAIEDFDRYIQLEPKQEPYHWQRGIAYYYAGKYDLGRKQFELHQSVNPHDVENGVWHFMCVARASSFEKAQESMIPISGDRRVPMTEILRIVPRQSRSRRCIEGDEERESVGNRVGRAPLLRGIIFGTLFRSEGRQRADLRTHQNRRHTISR
jgi:lipoprotein NlpI